MKKQDEGKIRRTKEGFEVILRGLDKEQASLPGVVCLEPRAPFEERTYKKEFKKKRIFLPWQYHKSTKEILEGRNVLRLGFNGYSKIDNERAKRWGVTLESYEAACSKLAYDVIKYLQKEFPGINIRLVNGASDMGIDRATNRVAQELNLPILGFSCPRYMIWVKDDEMPVYVARGKNIYSNRFVESLDVLVAANGAETAYKHDMAAALTYFKQFIPVDVISAISSTGGVPAFGPNGQVENAVKAYDNLVHMMNQQIGSGAEEGSFDGIIKHVNGVCKKVCRQKLEPDFAFPIGRAYQEHII